MTISDRDSREICAEAPRFDGKRVLVTGAAGFLGKWLTHSLRVLGAEVTGLDIVKADGVSQEDLAETELQADYYPTSLSYQYDFILHAAGNASPRTYRAKPLETLEVSHIGTRTALNCAQASPDSRTVIFSSSEIYGDPTVVPTPETYRGNVDCLGPRACYDEGKRVAETITRIYAERFGVNACIVRPFNVYGPGMSLEDYRVLPNIARSLSRDEEIVIYGTGQQTRTFCYVTDAIRAVLALMVYGESGEAYNVGNSGPEVTMEQLARKCLAVTGRHVPIVLRDPPSSYPGDEPQRRCPDLSKISRWYAPRVGLDDGLRRFFEGVL
jgi:UDP-glucuronate decarboxylase